MSEKYNIAAATPHVTVKTTLYGDVSAERLAEETRVARHRADQLSPVVKAEPKRRKDTDDEFEIDGYPSEFLDEYPMQSTGR